MKKNFLVFLVPIIFCSHVYGALASQAATRLFTMPTPTYGMPSAFGARQFSSLPQGPKFMPSQQQSPLFMPIAQPMRSPVLNPYQKAFSTFSPQRASLFPPSSFIPANMGAKISGPSIIPQRSFSFFARRTKPSPDTIDAAARVNRLFNISEEKYLLLSQGLRKEGYGEEADNLDNVIRQLKITPGSSGYKKWIAAIIGIYVLIILLKDNYDGAFEYYLHQKSLLEKEFLDSENALARVQAAIDQVNDQIEQTDTLQDKAPLYLKLALHHLTKNVIKSAQTMQRYRKERAEMKALINEINEKERTFAAQFKKYRNADLYRAYERLTSPQTAQEKNLPELNTTNVELLATLPGHFGVSSPTKEDKALLLRNAEVMALAREIKNRGSEEWLREQEASANRPPYDPRGWGMPNLKDYAPSVPSSETLKKPLQWWNSLWGVPQSDAGK